MNRRSDGVTAAAAWMAAELERRGGILEQHVAVFEVRQRFGPECAYINDSGNLALARPVLTEFRRLTEGTVVWDASSRLWRKRAHHDSKGRRVED